MTIEISDSTQPVDVQHWFLFNSNIHGPNINVLRMYIVECKIYLH